MKYNCECKANYMFTNWEKYAMLNTELYSINIIKWLFAIML